MTLDQGTETPPVDRAEVIDEDAAIGITHLQRSNANGFIANLERIVDYAIERLIGEHRNGSAVELRLAQLRLKQKRARAGTLEQVITLDAVAGLQTQEIIRPKLVIEQV